MLAPCPDYQSEWTLVPEYERVTEVFGSDARGDETESWMNEGRNRREIENLKS